MELNEHNKKEYPPMHTAEHLLNQTMVRMFGCDRSKSSHIERKKSKCDYFVKEALMPEQIIEIESAVNAQIERNLSVNVLFVDKKNVPANVDLSKLPENVSDTLRLVSVGDYDICACIGDHVKSTLEIGQFKIISTDFNEGKIRIRFKLENCNYTE
jgi:alanyl-tRNA synthetase